jgi:hypothetical protein
MARLLSGQNAGKRDKTRELWQNGEQIWQIALPQLKNRAVFGITKNKTIKRGLPLCIKF